jgi:excinuclease ABC A subunit
MQHEFITVRGAREHNLKNVDVDIPRNKLVVITGLSGSGKSSLAFDTIYAEGQRRYVECLSAYARQFLGSMERPDVDNIDGLSPAISIEQKTVSRNPRSTVGTVTEIYDYLRLLYARAGVQHCHKDGSPVQRQSLDQMVDRILGHEKGTRLIILAPVIRGRKGHYRELFEEISKDGFTKVRVDGEIREIEDGMKVDRYKIHNIEIVVDRLVVNPDARARLSDSLEIALKFGDGVVIVDMNGEDMLMSKKIPARSAAAATKNLHRIRSPSTPRTAPARPATDWARHANSISTSFFPIPPRRSTRKDSSPWANRDAPGGGRRSKPSPRATSSTSTHRSPTSAKRRCRLCCTAAERKNTASPTRIRTAACRITITASPAC